MALRDWFWVHLAAWQYRRLAAWFSPHLKSPWLGEIAAFLVIFLAVMIVAGIAGTDCPLDHERSRAQLSGPVAGRSLGLLRGCLLVAVVLMSMAAFTPASKLLAGSELAPYFLVVGRAAIWVAPSELRGVSIRAWICCTGNNSREDKFRGRIRQIGSSHKYIHEAFTSERENP